jgi:hypothetical protein
MNAMELVRRRIELALYTERINMAEYAEEWNKLSADFAALGMVSNAAFCESNWLRYKNDALIIQGGGTK